MSVAKRQGREEPTKIEQRKVGRSEREPQVKQTASMLDQLHRADSGEGEKKKHIKGGAKTGPRGPLFS